MRTSCQSGGMRGRVGRRWLVALAVLALTGLAGSSGVLRRAFAAGERPRAVGLRVFLRTDANPAESQAVLARLSRMPEVNSVRYIDKEEAFAKFRKLFAEEPDVLAAGSAEKMPPSYEVRSPSGAAHSTAKELLALPGVSNVIPLLARR